MSIVKGPVVIHRPLYTGTAHRIDLIVFADADQQTRKNIDGVSLTLLLKDAGGTLRTYDATIDSAADGEAHVDLDSGHHSTEGAATAQLLEDGIPIETFTLFFREKLS